MFYLVGLSEYPITGGTMFYLYDSRSGQVQSVNWSRLYDVMRGNNNAVSNANLNYQRVDGQLSVDIVLKSGSISELPVIQNGVCVRNKNFYVLCRYVAGDNKTIGYLILNYMGQVKRIGIKDLDKIEEGVKFINVKLLNGSAGRYFASIRGNLPVVQLKMNGENIKTKAGQKKVSPQPVSKFDTSKRTKEVVIGGHSHTIRTVDTTSENGIFMVKNGDTLSGLSKLGKELVSNGSLTKIIIPDGIVAIADGAFKGLSRVTNIDLGRTVRIVGDEAFSYCNDLKAIQISELVERIGIRCFYKCVNLEVAVLPLHLKVIDDFAFFMCEKLADSTPLSMLFVERIGNCAFSHCTALKKLFFSSTLKSVGTLAFEGCVNLEEVSVPKVRASLLTDNSAFLGCGNFVITDNNWS